MEYAKGIAKAIIPRKLKDIIAVTILTSLMTYGGYMTFLQPAPTVTLHTETHYPTEVIRGSYFTLNFDLEFGRACSVVAKRYIVGSDGVEYLALEDSKEVQANERMRYAVRIPVDLSVPYGPATFHSEFEYGCDWWSRHVRGIKSRGQNRAINVLSESSLNLDHLASCELPPEPGFTVVRAHYRRVAAFGVASNQPPISRPAKQ